MSLPSDIRLEVDYKKTKIDGPSAGIVRLSNGQQLGTLRESINGRWLAHSFIPPNNSIFAKTKTDAKNWLANECTELARISVDLGAFTEKRVISPVHLVGNHRNRVSFVDPPHNISEGQHLVIKGRGTVLIEIAQGTVSMVDGSTIEFTR